MSPNPRATRRAFSLIELVIVIIIMGVISAIAIPRMVRGAEGADVTGMRADLAVLRGAIEMYRYEHSAFPTTAGINAGQLTQKTTAAGVVDNASGEFGPYMVKMPALKTGTHAGESSVKSIAGTTVAPSDVAVGFGWLYHEASGQIWANDADHLSD